MANTKAPFETRIYYTVQGQVHLFTVPMDCQVEPVVGSEFSEISVKARGVGGAPLDTYVDSIVTLLRPFWSVNDDIGYAEFWKNDAVGFGSTYVATYPIGLAGTGSAGVVARQTIISLRSSNGGIAFLNLLETNIAGDNQVAWPFPAGAENNLAAYFCSTASPFVCRDNGYPIVPLRTSRGQNEALWRRRFRPT